MFKILFKRLKICVHTKHYVNRGYTKIVYFFFSEKRLQYLNICTIIVHIYT